MCIRDRPLTETQAHDQTLSLLTKTEHTSIHIVDFRDAGMKYKISHFTQWKLHNFKFSLTVYKTYYLMEVCTKNCVDFTVCRHTLDYL